MSSSSPAQAKFMRAVAHGMKPRGNGPSQAVGQEFMAADMAKQRMTASRLRGNPGHSKRESY
jgi:hypothetical protein